MQLTYMIYSFIGVVTFFIPIRVDSTTCDGKIVCSTLPFNACMPITVPISAHHKNYMT